MLFRSVIVINAPFGNTNSAAEHALALPGRCAPQTAGALIAQTVLAILEERDPDERSTAP